MSLQVGSFCYADAVAAGRAACSQFQPVSHISDTVASTLSCSSADATTGALNLSIVSTNLSTMVVTTSTTQQLQDYMSCVLGDYMDFFGTIFAALMLLYLTWFFGQKILRTLNWGRGENV
jgi:regulator of PEP synthase PpsR (kinase-PPPase family)